MPRTHDPAAPEYTLGRHEEMWVTAQVNQPGWNLFYGIALLVVAPSLAASVLVAGLTGGSTLIALSLSAVIAVGGVVLSRMGLQRIRPLQRLRKNLPPQEERTVEVRGLRGPGALLLRGADGRDVELRGPAPATGTGERSETALVAGTSARLAVYAPYDEFGAAPARLLFPDGEHAIGWVTDDAAARI